MHILSLYYYNNIHELVAKAGKDNIYISTTKESRIYTDIKYEDENYIIFGKETAGLPAEVHDMFIDRRIKIPMIDNENARSLNLANSVNIVLYEALRQLGFPDLK